MILESEHKDQLYTALAQAQELFPTIRVNRKAFKNEYADLHAILKPIRHILAQNGLAVHEWSGYVEGIHCFGARLAHKSGQYITNAFPFVYDDPKQSDQKTHKIAGAQTYFLRYHIKGLLGLTISDDPEDDDGQAHHEEVMPTKVESISQKEYDLISKKLEGHPKIAGDLIRYLKNKYPWFESLKDIPASDFETICDGIEKKKQQYRELEKKQEHIVNV